MKEIAEKLSEKFHRSRPEEVLEWFANEYKGRIAFSTSLGPEDQAILHMISQGNLPVDVFTLDTGRLFQETYDLLQVTVAKYGIPVRTFFPAFGEVEGMVNSHGINLFYDSIENRRMCCNIRKTLPLKRALKGVEAWITGMRREQSVTRTLNRMVEWDEGNEVLKINPLINLSGSWVWEYVRKNNIPYNPLHDKGYPSLGCQPCTRAVAPGEDERGGRWWWEHPGYKECGLHQ